MWELIRNPILRNIFNDDNGFQGNLYFCHRNHKHLNESGSTDWCLVKQISIHKTFMLGWKRKIFRRLRNVTNWTLKPIRWNNNLDGVHLANWIISQHQILYYSFNSFSLNLNGEFSQAFHGPKRKAKWIWICEFFNFWST